jgi:hypothetical protein
MEEVARLRRQNSASTFGVTAHRLLTRWWSAGSWSARERLLDNAEWLIQLEWRRQEQSDVPLG